MVLSSRLAVLSCLLATMAGTGTGQTLSARSTMSSQGTATRSSQAGPTVTLTLTDVARDSAIRAVVDAAGYELVFSKQFVKLNGTVSAKFSKTPLRDAVNTVLRGSAVISKISDASRSVFLAPDTTTRKDTIVGNKAARLRGRVVDSATRRGIEGVSVELQGTPKSFLTDADGQFYLGEIAPGKYILTARRLGYGSVTQTVALEPNEEMTMAFVLKATSTTLTTVVTTGSGDRQKYQVGNSFATIDADSIVASQSIKDISALLKNRAPGLQVTASTGSVGAPSRLRIRGISSIEASNNPIILLDGVRISNDYTQARNTSLPGANASPSRLDDIDPDIIESIEVLKGPAASTLFGSDAANGVIVIKTKRGQAGPARWTVRADRGLLYQPKDYAFPQLRLGYELTGGSKGNFCNLLDEARGDCVPIDSLVGMNLLKNSLMTSLARGSRTSVNVDVSGGAPALQYYFSGGYTDELGTAKLPEINRRLLAQYRGERDLPGWMKRPNTQTNGNFNGRLTGQFDKTSDFSVGMNIVQLNNRIGPDGMSGLLSDVRSPEDTLTLVQGWDDFQWDRTQRLTRAIASASGNWRPRPWLTGNLTYGWDFSVRDAKELSRRGDCRPICFEGQQVETGQIYTGRQTIHVQSLNLGGTASTPLNSRLTLRSAVGGQYVRNRDNEVQGSATDLAEGATTIEGANGIATADEVGGESAIAGLYWDESLALNDRLFIGAAIRRDVSSALGSSVAPLYPKWSISWVASQEPFFPWKDKVSLRLRAAFGHAGVQPDGSVKLRLYGRINDFVDEDGYPTGKYAEIYGIGNLNLRPERSVEREGGFELGVLNDRVLLDFTVFRKFTRDAIVSRPLAPSIDFGQQAQNIGNVLNTGAEATLSLRILERSDVSWSTNLGYGSRRNKLVTLGKGVEPFSLGFNVEDARVVEGFPLFSRWARPIVGFNDDDGDGIISPQEVRLGDSLAYIGPSEAKYDVSIMNSFGFLRDRIRLSANFQYVNGLVQFNQFRSQYWSQLPVGNIRGPLSDQAYVVASQSRPEGSAYGFFENVDFLRFTELSMSYTIPSQFARRLRARSAIVSVLATNLGIWTNYNGRDPDVNTASAAGNQYFNGAAFPQPRSWAFRVNLNF